MFVTYHNCTVFKKWVFGSLILTQLWKKKSNLRTSRFVQISNKLNTFRFSTSLRFMPSAFWQRCDESYAF